MQSNKTKLSKSYTYNYSVFLSSLFRKTSDQTGTLHLSAVQYGIHSFHESAAVNIYAPKYEMLTKYHVMTSENSRGVTIRPLCTLYDTGLEYSDVIK